MKLVKYYSILYASNIHTHTTHFHTTKKNKKNDTQYILQVNN